MTAHLQGVRDALRSGQRPPELARAYPREHPDLVHSEFERQLRLYPETTLGEIDRNVESRVDMLQRKLDLSNRHYPVRQALGLSGLGVTVLGITLMGSHPV
ncbi:MAG: hypothetical protein AB1758_24860, partial [Candidatus Eremiobacterota bacterium]